MRAPVAATIAAAFALTAIAGTAAEAPAVANPVGVSPAADVAAEAAAEPVASQPQPAARTDSVAPEVDRAAADAYTERFNRQELDALQSGGAPAGRGGWHALYPPRY